jgi:hypothetical protein
MLEQQQADHEAALDARAALVAVERRDLAVEPRPVDLGRELHELVLHVDDLVEPGPEQIAFPRRLVLLRPHRVLRCGNRITARPQRESQSEIARLGGLRPPNLAIQNWLLRRLQSLSRCSRPTIYDSWGTCRVLGSAECGETPHGASLKNTFRRTTASRN